jgi:hypothetical protein
MYLIGNSTDGSTQPALGTEAGPGTSKPYKGGGPTRRGEVAAFVLAVLIPLSGKVGRTAGDLLLACRNDRMA